MSEELNPFAPPEADLELSNALKTEISTKSPPSLGRIGVRWLLVCSISAAPSFYLGATASRGQFAAMALGVFIFAVGYTILDYKTTCTPIRQNRIFSITLRVVYLTRILITVVFPIGMMIDLSCGIFSVSTTEAIFGSSAISTFSGALFTTLVQGVILNLVLAIYGSLVVGVGMLFAPLFRSVRIWFFGPPG